jgi:putative tryptophan/tyrosine transport system substrate-binding protein
MPGRTTPLLSRRRFLRRSLTLACLGLLAGCSAPALPWSPARVPRIGYLALVQQGDPILAHTLGALRDGLHDLGYVEGQGMALEVRWADGHLERLPELAAELARLPVDVLVAGGGTQNALAAKQATATIPIVMIAVSDAVGAGLVAALDRPGGNVTGLTNTVPAMAGKRLQLLKEAAPSLARVDYFWNPANLGVHAEWAELQTAAERLSLTVRSREARGPQELDRAFIAIVGDRPDGLVVHGDASYLPHTRRIVDFVADQRLPAIYQLREFVEAGGLMYYGVSIPDLFRRAATYVDKILKGASPADLPVEQPTTFDFIINLKTAQALGLTIPPSLLQQATEIMQ